MMGFTDLDMTTLVVLRLLVGYAHILGPAL